MTFDQMAHHAVSLLHTIHGKIIPVLIFTFVVKMVTGVSLLALIVISILVAFVSACIFLVVISRMGFLRAVFDGRTAAVGALCLILGIFIGRATNN